METDRSRIIAFQRCPRERYLAYHVGGTGLQRTRKSLPLQFGSAFHEGSEVLFSQENYPLDPPRIEFAVGAAIRFLDDEFQAHQVGFDGELPADAEAAMAYGREEQMALAEALLRAWWAYEGETFLETFEVIEVEQEGRAALVQGTPEQDVQRLDGEGYRVTTITRDDGLVLMFRPDALVRDRLSGDHYVISWKTRATHTKRSQDQDRHDMQSISEVFGLSQSRGIKIEGVIYKVILKGKRQQDDWDGLWKQDTPLVYGWKRLGKAGFDDEEWSWSFRWQSDEINPKTGKPINRTLGKGWQKVPIWRDYPGGVKAWIEDLAANRVFPRHMDALAQVFPQALPVERRADEVQEWKEQIVAQELGIAKNLELVEFDFQAGHSVGVETLNALFPKYTHSCHSYSGCPFIPICWEGVKAEPGELYQIRLANHPEKGDSDE